MYGLVNKAVEQMVCTHFDTATWQHIKHHAGVDAELFLSLHQYPDEVTYRLVESASAHLGQTQDEILRAFGRYWMLYTVAEGYGELMTLTGSNLREFLLNLPNLHARVDLSFPHLRPPLFQCSEVTERSMLLHYHSERVGLAPMVVGLLEGLSERFQTPIRIELLQSREQGYDHEIFRLHVGE